MRKTLALIAILLCLPSVAQEDEPPLPRDRPAEAVAEAPGIRPAWTVMEPEDRPLVPLPRVRPEERAEVPAEAPDEPAEPRVYQVACPAVLQGRVEAKALPPIAEN